MEGTGKIFTAITAIMGELGAVGRDRVNQQQRFNYRGIDDLYNALQPLLSKHRVFTVPTVLEERRTERQSKSGGTLLHAVLKIQYRFYAEDGSYFDCVVIGEGMDSGDKASNKAESVAHKYALTQVFAVRTEDQQDPDSESNALADQKNKNAKPSVKADPLASKRKALYAIAAKKGYDANAVKAFLINNFQGLKSSKELNAEQLDGVIARVRALPDADFEASGPEEPPAK